MRANCSSNAFCPKYLCRYLLRTRTVTHISSSDQNQKISCNTILLSNLWNVLKFYQKCSSFHYPYPLFPPSLSSFLSFVFLSFVFKIQPKITLGDCYSGFLSPRAVAQPFFIFHTLTVLKSTGSLFVESPSIWVCPIFPHDWIQLTHRWQDEYIDDAVSFPAYHIRRHIIIGDVSFWSLCKVVSTRFLHYETEFATKKRYRAAYWTLTRHTLLSTFCVPSTDLGWWTCLAFTLENLKSS